RVRPRITVHFELAGAAERHGEKQELIADVRPDIERRRQRLVLGHPKRCAVGEHAGGPPQAELADGEKVALELDLGKTPTVCIERLTAVLDVALEVAILLLEVLRLQEEPLRPDDSVMRRHSRTESMTPRRMSPCVPQSITNAVYRPRGRGGRTRGRGRPARGAQLADPRLAK